MKISSSPLFLLLFLCIHCTSPSEQAESYDLILVGGTLYDGSGSKPFQADIGIRGDSIFAIGNLNRDSADTVLDIAGLSVAPGFINMHSEASASLIQDGRALSDLKQGITLEVLGIGRSEAPSNDAMKLLDMQQQGILKYDIKWNTLEGYFEYLAQRGLSVNIASYVNAHTIQRFVMGESTQASDEVQRNRMQALLGEAMVQGALGLSIRYPYPDSLSLHTLAQTTALYDGLLLAQLPQGPTAVHALQAFLKLLRETQAWGHLSHLETETSPSRLDSLIQLIESAQAEGLHLTAHTRPYLAEAGIIAPQSQELLPLSQNPEKVLLPAFKEPSLNPYQGKTLTEIAAIRQQSPLAVLEFLLESERSPIPFFLFRGNAALLQQKLELPWMGIGSGAESLAPEGVFLRMHPHPAAYGSVTAFLSASAQPAHDLALEEAIYRLTQLPAHSLKLSRRGKLSPGTYADLVVFDPTQFKAQASYLSPHQFSEGIIHVFVNGKQVLSHGEAVPVKAGQALRGPGWKGTSAYF